MYDFSLDYDATDVSDIINTHASLMKKHELDLLIFRLIKQVFIVLVSWSESLTSLV